MQLKAEIRKELLSIRNAIPPAVRTAKAAEIREKLASLEEIKNANVVLLFASFRTEVDTFGIMEKILADGKRIVLPKVDKDRHSLVLYEVKEISELHPAYMGIPEPSVTGTERLRTINDVDAGVIPGAGFDRECNRIGYGAGYYDILLSGLEKEIPLICPAYEEQIVDSIPAELHDRKINIIVTDRRIIRCGKY